MCVFACVLLHFLFQSICPSPQRPDDSAGDLHVWHDARLQPWLAWRVVMSLNGRAAADSSKHLSPPPPPHPPFTPPLPSLFISTHCVPLFYNVFIKLPSGLTWKGRTNKCHTWWNTPLFSWCVPHYTQIIFTGRLWALENWASQLLLFTMLWNVLIHSGNLLQWKRASGAERQQFTAALCVCVFTTACFFSASLLSYYWSIRPHQNQ